MLRLINGLQSLYSIMHIHNVFSMAFMPRLAGIVIGN